MEAGLLTLEGAYSHGYKLQLGEHETREMKVEWRRFAQKLHQHLRT